MWLIYFYLDPCDSCDSPFLSGQLGPMRLTWLTYFYSESCYSCQLPIFISGTLVAHVTQLFLFWLIWLTYFYPDSCDSCDSPISIRTPVTLVTHLFLSGLLWLMWLTYFYSDSCDSCDGGADTLYNGEHVTFLYSFLNTTGIKPMTIDQYVGVLAT